ncbi:MAG: peroxiredoxin [Polyangiales bacterium]
MTHTLRLALAFALTAACSRAASAPPAATPQPATPAPTTAAPAAPAPTAAAPSPAAPELAVTSPARSALLAAGDAAPSFTATTHDGRHVESNGAPRARALVVYFYPRDETPGCTREACSFRDASRAFDEAGADIVGVSTDTKAAHEGFASHHGLTFGLIADPRGQLAAAFGLDASGGFAPRVTFVIGRDGHIARVFPNVSVDGHADAVLAAVRASQPR